MINPKSFSVMLLSVSSPSLYMPGITPNQVQYLALGLVDLNEVLMSQLLRFIEVP